jgi:hypothetical protein
MIALGQAIHGRVGGLRPLAFPQATSLGLMALAVCCLLRLFVISSGWRGSRGRPEK